LLPNIRTANSPKTFLYVKTFVQKPFCKKFVNAKILDPEIYRIRKMLIKNILEPKKFGFNRILMKRKVLVQNNLAQKKFV